MMPMDIPTAYLFVGGLFLLGPASAWVVLSPGPSRAVVLWCGGGLIFGLGLVCIGGRPHLPVWLSYPVAAAMTFLGLCMKILALGLQLNRRWLQFHCLPAAVVHGLVFELLRAADLPVWRFAWNGASVAILFCGIAWLAFRLASKEASRSAWWLGMAYGAAAFLIALRVTGAVLVESRPDAILQSAANLPIVVAGLLVSIVGTMGFVGMFLDRARQQELRAVEQRTRAQESARLSGQMARLARLHVMNELTSSLAHEINQPLTALLTNAQLAQRLLAQQDVDNSPLAPLVTDIERDTRRAHLIVQRVRQAAGPDRGTRESVPLQRVIRDVLDLAGDEARKTDRLFVTSLPAEAVCVQGDPVQLAQILLNLLLNALQAMKGSGEGAIEVHLAVHKGIAQVKVRDHGPGIAPEHLMEVGTPLFTTKSDGSGLGLSISRSLAEQHGGHLVLCNAAGGGAEAVLSLPCAALPS